jgi:zinc protease
VENGTNIGARVRTLELACGARAHLLENHANPTVDVVGFLDGGLRDEPADLPGVADLAFAMLDRGTRRRDERAIAEALESNGASLQYGVGPETALLSGRCLSEDLELLLEVLGETLREPAFPEAQLRLEREETLVALRESAFDTLERAYRRAAQRLLGERDPYARDPLGEPAVVERITRQDLAAHHLRAVAGDRLTLALVGDIDPGRARDLLDAHLGALPRAGAATPPAPVADATPGGRGDAGIERIAIADKEQVDVVLAGPGVARDRPGFEAYGLANFLIGGSFVSRLNQRLRDASGLTYGAQSQIVSGRRAGLWFASFGVHPTDVGPAVDLAREELRRMVTGGVGEEELRLAQQHLTGSFPLRLETNRAVASWLLESVRFGRGLDYVDRYRDRIRGLTRSAVDEALRALIDPDGVLAVAAGSFAP